MDIFTYIVLCSGTKRNPVGLKSNKISIMSQKITSLHIDKLKGLENLDISFEDKNVTAIFGANGCGKSTILHALACIYKGISRGAETNYFTRFFKRIGTAKWAGSHMTAHMLIDEHTKAIVYKKSADRWTPRIDKRVERDSYYIGIESCVPDIEKESVLNVTPSTLPSSPWTSISITSGSVFNEFSLK